MRLLSQVHDDDALDLLAEIIEPAGAIMTDKKIAALYRNGNVLGTVAAAIKAHKGDVKRILATLEGVPVEEYHCTPVTLTAGLLEILNDPELLGFFESPPETAERGNSGSPMDNTEDHAE